MNRIDVYTLALAEILPLSGDLLKDQLENFVRKNGRWRRYFFTEVSAEEGALLKEKLVEQNVGLLGWLMVCGAVSPVIAEEVVHLQQEQCKAA